MLHLNAKMKKLRTQPTKLKRRSDKKFEPKLVHEPPKLKEAAEAYNKLMDESVSNRKRKQRAA